jgi:hypothetical protein
MLLLHTLVTASATNSSADFKPLQLVRLGISPSSPTTVDKPAWPIPNWYNIIINNQSGCKDLISARLYCLQLPNNNPLVVTWFGELSKSSSSSSTSLLSCMTALSLLLSISGSALLLTTLIRATLLSSPQLLHCKTSIVTIPVVVLDNFLELLHHLQHIIVELIAFSSLLYSTSILVPNMYR